MEEGCGWRPTHRDVSSDVLGFITGRVKRSTKLCAMLGLGLALGACSSDGKPDAKAPPSDDGLDAFDVPIQGIDGDLLSAFNDGDLAFGTPVREADGLGPLYTRAACSACHEAALRGPGLVQKMAVVEADGVTPAADQSQLPFGHTVHPLTAGGGVTPITAPDDPGIKVSERIGPPLLGRGYVEAVTDAEILRVEGEQALRSDAIHGRANHVLYASEPSTEPELDSFQKGDSVIGRFGLKARIATLGDFTADALQGDMGITSPMRPSEIPNPDSIIDDLKTGIDVTDLSVNRRAMYVRLLAIPKRKLEPAGRALFDSALCSVCHAPSLKTRDDHPIALLSGIEAEIYSDLLLHRMGENLADGLPVDPDLDGEAGSFDWRTAPLIGLRFDKSFLHDGRAKSVEEAIEMHGGSGSEANESIERFSALAADERADLVKFVEAL